MRLPTPTVNELPPMSAQTDHIHVCACTRVKACVHRRDHCPETEPYQCDSCTEARIAPFLKGESRGHHRQR